MSYTSVNGHMFSFFGQGGSTELKATKLYTRPIYRET